jgi:biotin-(acetyl-CoA carboxylase) ligase
MKSWNELDALRDQNIKITKGKEKIIGRAIGIDENGAVKVKARNGVIKLIHSGEVTLSKR